MHESDLTTIIGIEKLNYDFCDKPLVVGGLAMEYFGLRLHGDDIDFIISDRDYQNLKRQYPKQRKDVWADFGLVIDGFELFRSMYKFDYSYYTQGSLELTHFRMVSIDMLFRMKIYAMDAGEKHQADVKRLRDHFDQQQNKCYQAYLANHLDRYANSDSGIFVGVDYSDEE